MQADLLKAATMVGHAASGALLINSNLIALALADKDRLLFVNAAFSSMFGRAEDLTGVSLLDLLVPAHRERVGAALRANRQPAMACVAEASRSDGRTFAVELHFEAMTFDDETYVAIFARDVTDHLRAETRLSLLAYSNSLTGLGNRALFADRLRQAALTARRTSQPFAVLMLDLDGFKQVNDLHGHDAGDLVLRRISARLLACVRDSDTVARLGGDEFAILIPGIRMRADAAAAAERVVELARQPINLGKREVIVGTSVGIAIYPEHATTVDQLLVAADKALYLAKQYGRGRADWASPATEAEISVTPLAWNVAHEVGIAEIDAQHGKLVSLLNELARVLRNGDPYEACFQDVVRYTEFHFAAEERLMNTHLYRGAAAHRDMHQRLLNDLRELRLDGVKVSVSMVLRYLQEWLLRHVEGADRDLASALRGADAVMAASP